MSWIDEQMKLRIQQDEEDFEEACEEIAAAVTRKKRISLSDERAKIKNAIDEILRFYRLKSRDIPPEVKSFEDQLEYLCRPNGVMHRRIRLEKGWYRDATGAILGRLKSGGTVALLPRKWNGYAFYDEQSGRRVRLSRKTEALLEEDAICFYRPFPTRKMVLLDLVNYVRLCNTPFTTIKTTSLMLVATAVGMIAPKITQLLFSEVLESGSLRVLVSIGVLSVSVSISLMLIGTVKSLLMQKVNTNMEVSVQAATMARVLSLPTDFFKKYSAGEITSRAQYIGSLCATLISVLLSTSLTSLFSLVYISQVFVYAPALVIPSICVTLATIVFSQATTVVQMKITKKKMEISASQSGMTYAMLTGIQKIKLSGSEKRAFTRWLKHYTAEAKLTYSPPLFLLLNGVVNSAISLIGTVVMYYFAVRSAIPVADYYAFTTAYGMVSGAFAALTGIVTTAASIRPTIEMAKPIMDAVPEISAGKHMVTKLAGGIELNNVSFRYTEHMPLVLDNLSLKIRPGQYVAVVGKTGCGKSTLVRLLLGFETPQKGAVYFDGKDIASLDLKSLRKNIGVVMQNGKLFQGDIFSNIIISAPWLTMDAAWEAAELAGIADDIRKMPMSMQTMITEGSGGISGGQKQRLMIARAVAAKPKILILDEATSALDNLTQKNVSEALGRLKCTRLVIAHRLSTIQQCDRIIVLDGGKIAEDGTYEELIAKNGFFAGLVERQRGEG